MYPHLLAFKNKAFLEPRVSPAFTITYFCNFCNHCNIRLDPIPVKVDVQSTQGHHVQFPWTKGHWPLDDLWPQVCWGHMCDSTQGSLWLSSMKMHRSMWIQWPFFKNLNQRSLIPRWPLTPHLLRSDVWLYPRIIMSKSHGNRSMYVDTVINFAKYHIHTTYIHILHTQWVIT